MFEEQNFNDMKAVCLGIGLVILTWSCNDRQSVQSYEDQIKEYRASIALFMNESEDSPFKAADSVITLNYFPLDQAFKVVANIERIKNGEMYNMATSDGNMKTYIKFAYAKFKLEGQKYSLLILKTEDEGLFLGFKDKTSDESTYGGGRYINLSFDQATQITLDFNRAYNPYCAYSAGYSCPLPPIENDLPMAIMAGEKLY